MASSSRSKTCSSRALRSGASSDHTVPGTTVVMTAKDAFDAKMVETQAELERLWEAWDVGVDAGDDAVKARARAYMAAVTGSPEEWT